MYRSRPPAALSAALAALASLAACDLKPRPKAGQDASPSTTEPTTAPAADAAPVMPAALPPLTSTDAPARLVLFVVIDQLPEWALDMHLARLSPDGLLRRAIERGRRLKGEYPYAVTLTAVGHATLSTGSLPAHHGVYTNGVWLPDRKDEVSIVDDGKSAMLARPDAFAAPTVLRGKTIADSLRDATAGQGKVVSLSLKDRAAVLLGGRQPRAAVWYDKKARTFTTSSYYGEAPAWLTGFLAAKPVSSLLVPWDITAADRESLAALGPDDVPGEGSPKGFGRVFPHDPRKAKDPYDLLRDTPQLDEYLIELAAAAAAAEGLGDDEVPDLLALSVSTADYVGHMFGAQSWEYADDLRRVDLALGRLADTLAARGALAVVIATDHGGGPLIEWPGGEAVYGPAPADRPAHGRVAFETLTKDLERSLDKQRGKGDWIGKAVEPYVYLAKDGEAKRAEVVPQVVALLRARPGIAIAVDVAEARGWANDADPIRRAIAASIPDQVPADVLIVPHPGWVFDPEQPPGAGTGHGTPWPYDRLVPVIVAGAGVGEGAARVTTEPLIDVRRVASTVAALLGVPSAQRPGAMRPLVDR